MSFEKLTITTWLWAQKGYSNRKSYGPSHVNTLYSMVLRHLALPFEFVCITNLPLDLDPRIRVVPLPKVPSVKWPEARPNCFRRLWAFSDEAKEKLGSRIVNFDLDCVITGRLDYFFLGSEDFRIWQDPFYPRQYNGGFWMLRAGSRVEVWTRFQGDSSVREMRGKVGSDQGWISHVLPGEKTWTIQDGVFSFKKHLRQSDHLPKNARVVMFHGNPSPWEVRESYPWVEEHYW